MKDHPLARAGPCLITGVADDDPSGIATLCHAGAQFGLNMLWTMPLAFLLRSAMQYIGASIGRVTGKGLVANINAALPPWIIKSVVLSLLVANTLNIAADVAAMGEVAELVSGYNRPLMTTVFVILTLSLLAYAAVVVGVFGTTIGPYLFFWQASEEIEDMHAGNGSSLLQDSGAAPEELRRIRWDTWSGMLYSDLDGR